MPLLSEEYRDTLRAMHKKVPTWGSTAHLWATYLLRRIKRHDFWDSSAGQVPKILDYGCGTGSLAESLQGGYPIHEYDPGMPGKDELPKGPFHIVACIDVMEHIELDYVVPVLKHIWSLGTPDCLFYFLICTFPAKAILPDGRNAHLTVREADWWVQTMGASSDRAVLNPVVRGAALEVIATTSTP